MVPHAAPLQPAPFKFQVTAVFVLPVTDAENCCIAPVVTVLLFGETVIAIVAEATTLRVAALLTVLPILLVTTTEKSSRLSEAVAGGVVYDEELAPLIAVPFFCHW
jgi:hypothetical protein